MYVRKRTDNMTKETAVALMIAAEAEEEKIVPTLVDAHENEVFVYYPADDGVNIRYILHYTADGSGNERHNIKYKILDKDSQVTDKIERCDSMTEETAAALMIDLSQEEPSDERGHPDILEYKDDEYSIPQSISPESGETFDSVIETWIYDPEKEEPFAVTKQYAAGDIVSYGGKVWKCLTPHLGAWNAADFEETKSRQVVWGVGIIDKGESTEAVNRLIYPDATYISLINFNGISGLG